MPASAQKDAIVTALTGETSKAKDHAKAVTELRQALGVHRDVAAAEEALRELISMKGEVEYGATLITLAKAKPLVRRAVVLVEIAKEHYPDPTDKTGKFVCVDIKADKPLKAPVTLEAIKTEPKLADMELVKLSRLSVQSVTPEQWKLVCKMGGI